MTVADFNGGGRNDIFLTAPNERPFIATPSRAYVSRPDSRFGKITLNDLIMAHHGTVDGKPTVLAKYPTQNKL